MKWIIGILAVVAVAFGAWFLFYRKPAANAQTDPSQQNSTALQNTPVADLSGSNASSGSASTLSSTVALQQRGNVGGMIMSPADTPAVVTNSNSTLSGTNSGIMVGGTRSSSSISIPHIQLPAGTS